MNGRLQKAEYMHRVQTWGVEMDSCIIITRVLACYLTKDLKKTVTRMLFDKRTNEIHFAYARQIAMPDGPIGTVVYV